MFSPQLVIVSFFMDVSRDSDYPSIQH